MADLIKFKRGQTNASITTTSTVASDGEPVYDFNEGRLFIGDNSSTLASLTSASKYMLRWDKVMIPTAKLATGAVTTEKIAASAVTSAKIADANVTTAKLATGAVTSDKIADGTITLADLNCTKPSGITTIDAYVDQRAKAAAGEGVNVESAKKLATASGNTAVGSATKPVYFSGGIPTACSTYAGGTAVTLNGTSKAGSTASFYAPTIAGTNNYVLKSNGSGAPSWTSQSSLSVGYADDAGTATTANQAKKIRINDGSYYKITFTNGVLQFIS